MAAADDIKGKVGENLRGALEYLPLSYDLATIRCELSSTVVPGVQNGKEDKAALRALYETYEFRSWLESLDGDDSTVAGAEAIETDYETVLTRDRLDAWLKTLASADRFAFDTETCLLYTSPSPRDGLLSRMPSSA